MIRHISLILLLVSLCFGVSLAQTMFVATDQSFSVALPTEFGPELSPPAEAILAAERPQGDYSIYCIKGEAVDLEPQIYGEQVKRTLYDSGAQIHGQSQATLAGRPATSFLIAGVSEGKESLFVFNQREDAVYTFILNYPVGQRDRAANIWDGMVPSIKFRPVE